MQCKKCGAMLLDTDKFCTSCGEKILDTNPQYFNASNQPYQNYNNMNNQQIPNYNGMNNQQYQNQYFAMNNQQVPQHPIPQQPINQTYNTDKKAGKKSVLPIVLGIIGGFVGLIIIGIVVLLVIFSKQDKMICKSNEGSITIMYNKNGLTGYQTTDMTYKFEEQKEYAKQIGVDAYLREFNTWFINNTTGSCTIKGKEVEQAPSDNNNNNNNNNNNDNEENNSTIKPSETKVIGDETLGYVTIPNSWLRFHDPDAPNDLQYSYFKAFIVTMNVIDLQLTAKECATNFMYNIKNTGEVTDVNGATVKIGKNKEYEAYQVYMYYPSDSSYLVTYWFEAEDGKVHYIALEGPESYNNIKLTDLLFIPESFSLKNE